MWLQAHLSGDGDTLAADRLSSELSSRGTLPVVMATTNTATYQIPVEWRSVSILYNVIIYYISRLANVCVCVCVCVCVTTDAGRL